MTSEKKFDLRVHLRDTKTGKIDKIQPYQLKIKSGAQRFYRGGIEFYANGEPINPSEVKNIKAPLTMAEQVKANLRAEIKEELKEEILDELEKVDISAGLNDKETDEAIEAEIAAEKALKAKLEAEKANKKAETEKKEIMAISQSFGFSDDDCQEIFKKAKVQTFEEAKKALTEARVERDKSRTGKKNKNLVP